MTSTWFGAAPELVLIVLVLGAPGLLLARCLRFRWWDAVGLSVPLSLGVLAVADEVAMHSSTRWGLPVVVATTAVLAVLCWVAARLLAKNATIPGPEIGIEGPRWETWQYAVAAAVTLAAAVVGAVAVARGIGTPHAINQTWDGVFHVNAIDAVARHHSGAPSVVSQAGGPTSAGFYPPLFAATAALATIHAGVNPIVAANVLAVAIALVWPLTMSLALRRIARPGAFGYSVAMWGTVSVSLFPALLLQYGTVWPNALSILAIAPALVLMLRILGLDRGRDGAVDPAGPIGWWASLIALVIVLAGIGFSQPASAFALFYLGAPMLIWFLWRRFIAADAEIRRRAAIGTGVVLGVGLISAGLIWASYRIESVRSTGDFYWVTRGSVFSALRRLLELHSFNSEPNLAFGVLAVVGIVAGLRHARGRLLAMGYVILATCYVFTFAVQSHLTMHVTGYWYNDAYRIIGMLPVVVLPLAALGADALLGWLRVGIGRLASREKSTASDRGVPIAVASALVIGVGIIALQTGPGTADVTKTVHVAYATGRQAVVLPAEAAMFRRLGHEMGPGETIAGNPFNGEALVGVLSGRTAIYPSFSVPQGSDRVLVGRSFATYQDDPAVCAAVQRLKIGVVVTGQTYPRETVRRHAWWAGFDQLNTVRGLTLMDHVGEAAAYRVGPCKS